MSSLEQQILELPRSQKLSLMETLWSHLCEEPSTLPSPSWHEDELRKTELRLDEGEEHWVDWQQAKAQLKNA